jgi:hypothetical protein
MPWWSWIVIWVALIALSLLYVALLGFRLWRGFTATVKTFENTTETLEQYAAHRREFLQRPEPADPLEGRTAPADGLAVFADPDEMRQAYLSGKAFRIENRRRRRVDRRSQRGQRQSLRDLALNQPIV